MTVEENLGSKLKELTLRMARAAVDHPDQVRVEQVGEAAMIKLELRAAPDDIGRVIGKRGRVADAMRLVLRVSAAKEHQRVHLEIVEP